MMKTNLKTFPKFPDDWQLCRACTQAIEWREAFEKQLREKLMELPFDKNTHEVAVALTIKEILGEQ